MTRRMSLTFFSLLVLCSACATSGKTTLLGLGLGTLAGGTIGILADGGPTGRVRTRNTFMGTTLGGALGAVVAYFTQPNEDKTAPKPDPLSEKKTIDLLKPQYTSGKDVPLLLQPQVDTKYIDDQVRGNTFIPGHLEFQIVRPAQWSKE